MIGYREFPPYHITVNIIDHFLIAGDRSLSVSVIKITNCLPVVSDPLSFESSPYSKFALQVFFLNIDASTDIKYPVVPFIILGLFRI